ncbi:hypothetical protein K493DRAFT_298579 [Basidiobolus meristosporus CBS 931.73]|uniref:Uncharacterized protein n=1 Tax=Basidiobolus meristosporus CBS 931.73 TaxID=1314790 RepID=A0A1Y1YSJ8_9FUNG|nr:hypothetical protein K493DRAFT_298579 [Basidiobolus meristosporus CBS 931.73]|eukprot:ORY01000.1 hypothetical protein K493DRAFT_298579 [Basidiobolus meristosporus CBS 931.73]
MDTQNHPLDQVSVDRSVHYKPTSTFDCIAREDIEPEPSIKSPIARARLGSVLRTSEDSTTGWPNASELPSLFPTRTDSSQYPPPYVIGAGENRHSYEVLDQERRPTEYEIIALPKHTPIVAFCPNCQASVSVHAKEKTGFARKLTLIVRKLFRSRKTPSSCGPVNFSSVRYLCNSCNQDIHLSLS